MRRRLVRLLPPLLLAAATLWLNRDSPQRQLGIARHEARRALSPQGFRATLSLVPSRTSFRSRTGCRKWRK